MTTSYLARNGRIYVATTDGAYRDSDEAGPFLDKSAMPTGGTTDQVLAKSSSTDYATKWADAVSAFTDLSDVPSAYTDDGGNYVRVNSAEDALEFTADLIPPQYTVATLPTTATLGTLAVVTDSADTITYRGTPTTGSGTTACLVMWTGTAWEYH